MLHGWVFVTYCAMAQTLICEYNARVTPMMMMISQFNGTSTLNGSYSAKTGDNDCNVNSSSYSLRTALCESIRYQAKSEQNVRQDPIPRERHGEAAHSSCYTERGHLCTSWFSLTHPSSCRLARCGIEPRTT